MSIHIYKGHVIGIEAMVCYPKIKYVGDVYHNGEILTTQSDPSEVGVRSICVTYVDNLGGKIDE